MTTKDITFKDIQDANEIIKTVNIKGKEYAEVNQRIKAFRMLHPNGVISTHIHSLEYSIDGVGIVTMKATVADNQGNTLGTGYAQEIESKSGINSTSYIENCETSAVGRALAMCGIGINNSIASKEEVENAIEQQTKGKIPVKKPTKKVNKDTGEISAEDSQAQYEHWCMRVSEGKRFLMSKKYKYNIEPQNSIICRRAGVTTQDVEMLTTEELKKLVDVYIELSGEINDE